MCQGLYSAITGVDDRYLSYMYLAGLFRWDWKERTLSDIGLGVVAGGAQAHLLSLLLILSTIYYIIVA